MHFITHSTRMFVSRMQSVAAIKKLEIQARLSFLAIFLGRRASRLSFVGHLNFLALLYMRRVEEGEEEFIQNLKRIEELRTIECDSWRVSSQALQFSMSTNHICPLLTAPYKLTVSVS